MAEARAASCAELEGAAPAGDRARAGAPGLARTAVLAGLARAAAVAGLVCLYLVLAGCGGEKRGAEPGEARVPSAAGGSPEGGSPGAASPAAGSAAAGASEAERAVAAARELFRQKKAEGQDMSRGPCLAQEIIPGWAVDVAHDPRQPVDDDPANQCQSFREGRADHFVELDPDGNVIRVY